MRPKLCYINFRILYYYQTNFILYFIIMRKTDKKISDIQVDTLVARILENYNQNQSISSAVIADLYTLRERYILHEQPTVVKSIRLCCEHLEKFNQFQLTYWNDEEDGELTVPIFEYYVGLIANPTNKYNRDEIKEVNILLKASLTGEIIIKKSLGED